MAIRVPSRLYRSRHGVFYFRLTLPADLRELAGRSEVRLSLGTEVRQRAVIAALPLIAEIPGLLAQLRDMVDEAGQAPSPEGEGQQTTLPPDYFALWRASMLDKARLSAEMAILRDELQDARLALAASVPRLNARTVAQQAHTLGQLAGKQQLEERLAFPWAPERTKPISELIAAYLKGFDYRAKGGRRKPLGAKSLDGYRNDLEQFVILMGDVRIGAITRELAGEYFDLLRRLPPNMSRRAQFKGKTIPEILAMGCEPQTEVNASKKLERLSGAFKWALKEKRSWGIDANPFEGFGQSGEGGTKRRPFTPDEMRALLTHKSFTTRKFLSPYTFWLILLATFTGARLGELCQLDLQDFVTVDGVECIDINDTEAPALDDNDEPISVGARAKRVKTRNAKRLIPIHHELIRLGLLRYVEARRQEGQRHLFPELSRERRDGPAQAASNWFQRYRKSVGIVDKQQAVFHSFRHGFITTLLDGGISPHMVAPVVGHEGELITGKVYWNKRDATKRKPTVDAFTLAPALLALIPSIEDVKFLKAPGRKPGSKAGPKP